MLVDPRSISPSQDFLKEKTVTFILNQINSGNEIDLPPTPIVRRDESGELVAIDGHNLLVVRAYLGQAQEVHIAASPHDGLSDDSTATSTRNQELRDKFVSSLRERNVARAKGVRSFDDLIKKYSELFSDVSPARVGKSQ